MPSEVDRNAMRYETRERRQSRGVIFRSPLGSIQNSARERQQRAEASPGIRKLQRQISPSNRTNDSMANMWKTERSSSLRVFVFPPPPLRISLNHARTASNQMAPKSICPAAGDANFAKSHQSFSVPQPLWPTTQLRSIVSNGSKKVEP